MEPVLHRLKADHPLSQAETSLVLELGADRRKVSAGEDLPITADTSSWFLLSGWVAHQRTLSDGRCQILRLSLPGDLVTADISAAFQPGSASVVALSDLVVVAADQVLNLVRNGRAHGLEQALRISARRREQLLLDSVLRLGRLSAYERTAHLFLELNYRLTGCGVGDGRRFPMPLTQQMLADVLGLSVVHVNRVLQRLRREGSLELRSGVGVLRDAEALRRVAAVERISAAQRPAAASRVAEPAGVF